MYHQTPPCAADMESEVLVVCRTAECGIPLLVGHVFVCCGWVFIQILVVLGATNPAEVVASGSWGTFGWCCPHAAYTRGLTAGLGLHGDGLLCVVASKLQAEFIYEDVEGAIAVASTGVGP